MSRMFHSCSRACERRSVRTSMHAATLGVALVLGLAACAPKARPLTGAPTRAALPTFAVDPRPHVLEFTWEYKDETFEAAGEGAVRVQGPDRARLDFFLRNGMAGGYAILIGDTLSTPGGDLVKRLLPPAPLLWASLGRLALPAAPDTAARMDGDTLRADLGALRGKDASGADGRARMEEGQWRRLGNGRVCDVAACHTYALVPRTATGGRAYAGDSASDRAQCAGHAR